MGGRGQKISGCIDMEPSRWRKQLSKQRGPGVAVWGLGGPGG